MEKNFYNWPALGNERVIAFLERSLRHQKIAQTYIFIGPDNLGKATIALAFARNLQGGQDGLNSDLHILEPLKGKNSITIEQVREFIKILNLSSFLNSYKIGIIKEADALTAEAKSALLKTLEEPKDKVVVILLAAQEENLPATILSRSQILYFYPVPAVLIHDYLVNNYGVKRSLAKDLANLSLGRPLKALHFWENQDEYQSYLERAKTWLSFFTQNLNERLALLDQFFAGGDFSRRGLKEAAAILDLAEGLGRDLFLLSLGESDRLEHSALSAELKVTLAALESGGESAPLILNYLRLIGRAKEYLAANVSPRLLLEQVVINF